MEIDIYVYIYIHIDIYVFVHIYIIMALSKKLLQGNKVAKNSMNMSSYI